MESARRWGGWRVAAAGLVAVLVALGLLAGSCAVRDGDGDPPPAKRQAPSGPSAAALAGLEDGSDATTTTTPSSGTSTTGADPTGTSRPEPPGTGPGEPDVEPAAVPEPVGQISAEDCRALSRVAIPAAVIITEADFAPLEQRSIADGPGGDTAVAAAHRVAVIVPAGARSAWQAAAGALEQAAGEQRPLSLEERDVLFAARNQVEVWARASCPDAPPSWECDHFGSIGGPDVAPTVAEGASPERVLRRTPDSGAMVVLQRSDGIVLFGRVDERGFVQRTIQVEPVDGGWAVARRHICHADP